MGQRPNVVDFETEKIQSRPVYPPKPVGVAIKEQGKRAEYLAWSHPTGNNCTKADAIRRLKPLWQEAKRDGGAPILMHHAKFDLEVARVHLGLEPPPWRGWHDSMFALFLDDPHAMTLELKPVAYRMFDMAPDEGVKIREWLITHKIMRKGKKEFGEFISQAPGNIVAPYAMGDVNRTLKIFEALYQKVLDQSMGDAYDRERRLLPLLMRNEREGIRVDVKHLKDDIKIYEIAQQRVDTWIRRELETPDLNIDSDRDLAAALEAQGAVTEWTETANGGLSVSKVNLLPQHFRDPRLARALGYHNRLATCLGTFMKPWLIQAEATGGTIHTNWHQVRGDAGGTRTGRPSTSNPNFLNLPKSFTDKNDGYVHPKHLRNLEELPLVRRYVLPDTGHVFAHRDYNQQEYRVLAHFEDGGLCQAYSETPRLDVHTFVQDEIERIVDLKLERRAIKTVNFRSMYGGGAQGLADMLGIEKREAQAIMRAQKAAVPGLAKLEYELKLRAASDLPIRTWGGRVYFCEPPRYVEKFKRVMTFDYKLLNVLVQGSAADMTKEALIRYDDVRKDSRFLVTVYDEINVSAPKGVVKTEMNLLKDAMESIEVDVPMPTDGKIGPNWGSLKKYED